MTSGATCCQVGWPQHLGVDGTDRLGECRLLKLWIFHFRQQRPHKGREPVDLPCHIRCSSVIGPVDQNDSSRRSQPRHRCMSTWVNNRRDECSGCPGTHIQVILHLAWIISVRLMLAMHSSIDATDYHPRTPTTHHRSHPNSMAVHGVHVSYPLCIDGWCPRLSVAGYKVKIRLASWRENFIRLTPSLILIRSLGRITHVSKSLDSLQS